MRKVVETETGVYQPLSLRAMTLPPLLALVTATILALAGKVSFIPTALFMVSFFAVSLAPFIYDRWKYGQLGKPTVSVNGGILTLNLPNDSRGQLTTPLATLQEIIVYGPEGHPHYRLILKDGAFIEAAPMWPKAICDAVIRFLERKTFIKVSVKEPQSFFSYVRGDGP